MKLNKNYWLVPFFLCATLVATGCSDDDEYASNRSYYNNMTLSIDQVDAKNVLALRLAEESYPLTVTVAPHALSSDLSAFVFEVADTEIATIDNNGVLSLLKAGETTLTVKHRGDKYISTSCTLRVVASQIHDIVVSSGIVMSIEEPVDLSQYIAVMPWSADKSQVSFAVKPGYENVLKIEDGCIAYGLGMGEAVVEVRSTDGLNVAKELQLTVKGSTPITDIQLNEEGSKVNGQQLLIGQEIDLASLVSIYPENAADKNLKFSILKGGDCVQLAGDKLTITAAGEVELSISPLNEELNTGVPPCNIAFTVKSWNEREFWKVTTSITYSSGRNYVDDKGTGNPEHILDDKFDTFLSLVKPGKTYGSDKAEGKDVPLFFVVDMGMPQTINYFTWGHRNTNQDYLRVWGISLYGSNNGTDYTSIKENITIDHTTAGTPFDTDIPESTYRYLKVVYTDWSDNHGTTTGSTVQVAEFNVGKK